AAGGSCPPHLGRGHGPGRQPSLRAEALRERRDDQAERDGLRPLLLQAEGERRRRQPGLPHGRPGARRRVHADPPPPAGGMTMRFDCNILFVEDQPDWIEAQREALRDALGRGGFRWRHATTAAAARSLLASERFHFVSIDQNIPEKAGDATVPRTGLDLCEL